MTPDPNLIEDLRLLEAPNYWWVLWVVLGAILLGGSIWAIRRKGPERSRVQPPAPGRPAHELALEALEELVNLLKPHESRRYGIESTSIIRTYIESRFGIRAPMQATEEFLVAASHSNELEPRHRELLKIYLERCDLLKFARSTAAVDELSAIHRSAVDFVTESIEGAAA